MAQQLVMTSPADVKAQLPHTWPAFFARHGNLTAVQQQAIPPILAGRNTLVIAATASGKTEAALAPLVERHLVGDNAGWNKKPALCILYICPTKALVRDLYERLAAPLQSLGIFLAMKSGDTGPVPIEHPPAVLITTPESTDSLLTRAPKLFTTVRAVILDEIHLFDHSVRGDHLRCLLRRIETIQHYSQQQSGASMRPFQRVALSATVPDPGGIVDRYLLPVISHQSLVISHQSAVENLRQVPDDVVVVNVSGGRRIVANVQSIRGLDDLVTALALRSSGASIRKSLLFCNTRNEVEQVAAYLRRHLPYAAAIFVHYSNLDPALRREVEDGFAQAGVAICVCTSTLELGIDIGSIDDVVLIGPPPTPAAFLQRIGRGGRRRPTTQVLCLARSPLEEARFQALLDLAQLDDDTTGSLRAAAPAYHFRPSVLVQQVFSILKQSPTGSLRLADLRRVAPPAIDDEDLRRLLRHLALISYLRTGRPGEWRPGPAMDPLLDEHEIYSNIGADPLATLVVDAHSGRTLAQTGQRYVEGDTFLMGGRTLEVVWRDRYRIGVRAGEPAPTAEELRFQTAPFAVPLEVSLAVARHLGVAPNELCLVHDDEGVWLFHFWGDLYGTLLAGILQAHLQRGDETAIVRPHNELCLHLPGSLRQSPAWDAAVANRQLRLLLPRVEPFLALGRFHGLLPVELAERTALALCDLPRFESLYRSARLITPASGLRARLETLIQ